MSAVLPLGDLLLRFAECHRQGDALEAPLQCRLDAWVREVLWSEIDAHRDEIPVRDARTRHVTWAKDASVPQMTRELWTNARDSGECIETLVKTLDRLLRKGVRRRRAGVDEFAPPRLAQQVDRRLGNGQPLGDPEQLVRDCVKHAIYDEMRNEVRRLVTGSRGRRRKSTPRQPRRIDGRALVRGKANLLLDAARGGLEEELAFCLAYEYMRGRHDRPVFAPFEHCLLGSATPDSPSAPATLKALLDAIDEAFVAVDSASAAETPGNTRRKPARQRGLGAAHFTKLLAGFGVDLKPSSIPKLYSRHRGRLAAKVAGAA